MFEIELEWQDAPGVADPLLARTWARLGFRLDGRPLTRYWSERSKTVQEGIYGSVFPLAEWIGNHWWALLNEGPRHWGSGSARNSPSAAQGWLMRHNMLTCREGMAYPDLAIFRKDEDIALRWFADPDSTTTSGRFLDEGLRIIGRRQMEAALESVVLAVLGRANDLQDDALDELEALWSSISKSDPSEARVCSRLGMMGLDPHDPDLDEAIEHTLQELPFDEQVIVDLLAASSATALAEDLYGVTQLIDHLPPLGDRPRSTEIDPPTPKGPGGLLPYRVGYSRASAVRAALQISEDDPLSDLESVIERMVGESTQDWVQTGRKTVDAAIQVNGVAAMTATPRNPKARRFLQGRALHHWLYVSPRSGARRLLTHGHDWVQAASRAFSAELLAPARALASRLRSGADLEQHDELAEEFGVSSSVITHQIDNHRLG